VVGKIGPVANDVPTRLPDGGVANGLDVGVVTSDSLRDRFWPKSVLSLLGLAAVMTLASAQFVLPTRRWRPSLPARARRLIRRRRA
jgi:hypothetical protein